MQSVPLPGQPFLPKIFQLPPGPVHSIVVRGSKLNNTVLGVILRVRSNQKILSSEELFKAQLSSLFFSIGCNKPIFA